MVGGWIFRTIAFPWSFSLPHSYCSFFTLLCSKGLFEKIVCTHCPWFLFSLKSIWIILLPAHPIPIETALVKVTSLPNSMLNSQPSLSWLINSFWHSWTLPAPWYTFSLHLASRPLHSPGCQKDTPHGSLLGFSPTLPAGVVQHSVATAVIQPHDHDSRSISSAHISPLNSSAYIQLPIRRLLYDV